MWIDSEVYVADEDYKRFADRGLTLAEIREHVAVLYKRYPIPLSANADFNWDEYFASWKKDEAVATVPEEENVDLGKQEDEQNEPEKTDEKSESDKNTGKHEKSE
jgi:hypothetical protein